MIEKAFSIEIQAPVQRVWDEVTRRHARCDAMFGTYLHGDLKPGSFMTYRSKDGSRTFVAGEILEVEPPRRFVHTFFFSMEADAPTLVEWTLESIQSGTKVTVLHSRFEGETRTYKSVSTSWPAILGLYKAVIETGQAPFFIRLRNSLMHSMNFMLPATTRTEKVEGRR